MARTTVVYLAAWRRTDLPDRDWHIDETTHYPTIKAAKEAGAWTSGSPWEASVWRKTITLEELS